MRMRYELRNLPLLQLAPTLWTISKCDFCENKKKRRPHAYLPTKELRNDFCKLPSLLHSSSQREGNSNPLFSIIEHVVTMLIMHLLRANLPHFHHLTLHDKSTSIRNREESVGLPSQWSNYVRDT